MPLVDGRYRRPQLRNAAVNYSFGWFFVTFQVAGNKSELGAIVGRECVLNPLGEAVAAVIESIPRYNPDVVLDASVVMPNHVHVILKIESPNLGEQGRCPLRKHRLGQIIGKLKSLAAREYRLLKERGLARDIGSKLWQENYWEKIIPNHERLLAYRKYIADNPANWSHDRFGPVVAYQRGNPALLDAEPVAFVASQEGSVEEMRIERWGARGARGTTAPHPESEAPRPESGAPHPESGAPHPENGTPHPESAGQRCEALSRGAGALPPALSAPVISTFTSAQERAVLARVLAKGRRFIAVYPGGIPDDLPPAISKALLAGRALLLSPVTSGTGINKQRAVWCNEFVLRQAAEIWHGAISPGGTLASLLMGLKEPSA